MIHNLECYADNSLLRDEAGARKLMQVTGLADPVPAAAVLGPPARGGHAEDGTAVGDGKRDYGTDEIKVVEAVGAETGGRVADI